jgi:AraC-like DNA-binding protein
MIPATQIRQLSSRGLERAEPVEIWKARKFIHEHADEELSLTEVGKAVNISANHLSEKFKKVAGINFVDYVARIRVGKACDLLQNSNLRISEIAFAVGFQSLSQFNRVFKKLTRKSPTQFRTAHNKACEESLSIETSRQNSSEIFSVKMRSQLRRLLR